YFAVMFPGLLLMFLFSEECARQPKVIVGCIIGLLFGCTPILFYLAIDHPNFLKWTVNGFVDFLNVRSETMMGGPASPMQVVKATLEFMLQMLIPIGFTVAGAIEEYRCCGLRNVAGRLALVGSAYLMAISPIFVNDQYLAPLALLLLQFSVPRPSS